MRPPSGRREILPFSFQQAELRPAPAQAPGFTVQPVDDEGDSPYILRVDLAVQPYTFSARFDLIMQIGFLV